MSRVIEWSGKVSVPVPDAKSMLPEPKRGNPGTKVCSVGKRPPNVFVPMNVKSTGTAQAAPANTTDRALASNKIRYR